MPNINVDDTLSMHYEFDSFVEPWRTPETIMLVHGIGGCTEEWYAWVPPLSGKYAVLRVDLRGWGKSSIPPEGYTWSMDHFANDLVNLMNKLGLAKVHIVGAKLGGRIALHLAKNHPEQLHSMTLVCTPMTIRGVPNDSRERRPTIARGRDGVEEWARSTMPARLAGVSPDMMEWWNELYSNANPRVISEVFNLAWDTDEFEHIKQIDVPTLVIESTATKEFHHTGQWQKLIPNSRLVELPTATGGRQISATRPAECVEALVNFLRELSENKRQRTTKA
jgi:pimeloyl-ACP methyl ester carboxylesterase